MKHICRALFLLLALASYAQAGTLFRWVDKDGKIHYGDKPAEDAIAAEQKKFSAPAAAGDGDLSYGIRKARQDFPVILYVAKDCAAPCAKARSFLNQRGIPFAEKSLASKEEVEAYRKLTGGTLVPALMVGKALLNGFEPGQWNSELDIAGYPKIAAYGARTSVPAASKPAAAAETEQ